MRSLRLWNLQQRAYNGSLHVIISCGCTVFILVVDVGWILEEDLRCRM